MRRLIGRAASGEEFAGSEKKKACAPSQTDNAGPEMLNAMRCGCLLALGKDSDAINPSMATIRVPAGMPKRRTERKTNVSEIERAAGIDGILTVADPLSTVNDAKSSHWLPTG